MIISKHVCLQRSQLRYLLTPSLKKEVLLFLQDTLKWQQLELRKIPGVIDCTENEPDSGVFVPGGGLAKSIFQKW